MWIRTIVGFLLGLLVSVSVGLSIVFLVPSRPIGLLISFLGGFVMFAGLQTWVYCAPRLKPVMLWSLPTLAATLVFNAVIVVRGVG